MSLRTALASSAQQTLRVGRGRLGTELNPSATKAPSRYQQIFQARVQQLKHEGRYRVFRNIERQRGAFPEGTTDGKVDTVNWCSNDYLAMGQHPSMLTAATQDATAVPPAGVAGLRSSVHVALERELASVHKKEQAVVFNSCYTANEASIAAIVRAHPNCVILSDSDNHASMIQGIRQSGAPKMVFEHNNVEQLQQQLASLPQETPKLVIFESVYSMDGTVGKIEEILQLCEQSSNTISFIDEVHAVGLYGAEGGGVCQQLGLEQRVDILTGTLGKAYGALGGYVALSSAMRNKMEDNMPEYQKDCFLPASMIHAALSSVQHLRQSQQERSSHQENAAAFRAAAEQAQLPVMDSSSHILPLVVGDPEKCMAASQMLFDRFGVYVQPINFPTVPVGSERLRCTPGPTHTPQMLVDMVCALREVYQELDIPLAPPLASVDTSQAAETALPGCCGGSESKCPCAPFHAIASGAESVEDYRRHSPCPFSSLMAPPTVQLATLGRHNGFARPC